MITANLITHCIRTTTTSTTLLPGDKYLIYSFHVAMTMLSVA
jgi:hypothetical protein